MVGLFCSANYCQYIQKLINHIVPKCAMPKAKKAPMELITLSRRGEFLDVPEMMPAARHRASG